MGFLDDLKQEDEEVSHRLKMSYANTDGMLQNSPVEDNCTCVDSYA